MRAKLPIALALGALLVLPVLAQTLLARSESGVSNAAAQPARGDTLTMPPASKQLSVNGNALPSRGMTMAQVEESHGNPASRRAPVGDPPITRWEYPGFVVYFEYRHVIHSVTKISQ